MNLKLKNKSFRLLPYLLLILVAFAIIWPQIHSRAFVSGLDYYFHMSRTYETAMQIKTWHFSYFLSLFSWDHNARILNALYGPIGGYLSGVILLLAKSWYHWEIIVSLIAMILAGSIMYYLGHYWHIRGVINFLISILYMLSSPISDFVFKQTFSGFAAALVPLIVLLASEILVQKDISPVKLALILVLIIEIHFMTFVLSMTFLIPCILLGFFVAGNNWTSLVKHVSEAAGLTIILSFNVWGTMLEVLGSNLHHIIPTIPGTKVGTQDFNTIMNTYPRTNILQTPSIIGLMVAIFIAVTVILWIFNLHRVNYIVDVFMLFGLAFIWASSTWFPWGFVQRHFSFITVLIQFPKRFLPIGLILIYLLMGIILSKDINIDKYAKTVESIGLIFLCVVVGWCWQNNNGYLNYKINDLYNRPSVIDWVSMRWRVRHNPNLLRASLRNDHPDQFFKLVGKPVPDYLSTNIVYHSNKYKALDPYDRYVQTFYHHGPYHWSNHGKGEQITIDSRKRNIQLVPFVKYSHTKVVLNHHEINPKINKVGAMYLPLRRGFNQFSIQYQPSDWFKIGMLISLLIWFILIIDLSYMKLRHKDVL